MFSLLIVGVMGTTVSASSGATTGDIAVIAPPASVVVGAMSDNALIYAFDEAHGVTLGAPVSADIGGTIPAGTAVDSHYIHFDPTAATTRVATITFSRPILGVITSTGNLVATDSIVGLGTVAYGGTSGARGSQDGDTVTVSGSTVTLSLSAVNRGRDDLRIITLAEPADSDNDGVPDDEDAFPNSDTSARVVIDGCDSGVSNQSFPDGAFFNDLIAASASDAGNHGEFVSSVTKMADGWKKVGLISGKDKGAITSCAARSDIAK